MPVRGPRLAQHATGPPLRHPQLVADQGPRLPASGRAQQFPEVTSLRIALSRAWSATSCLSRVFSRSSSLSRLAWSRRRPPYSFRHRDGCRGRWPIAQRAVRPNCVVLPTPPFDQDLCFRQRVEDLAVEQFVAQLPVERFDIPVLPGTPRLDEQRLHLQGVQPQPDARGRKLRAVGRANVRGEAMRHEQLRQRLEHLGRPQPSGDHNRQTFPRILLDDGQDLQRSPVVCPRRQKVIRPHVEAIRGTATHTRPGSRSAR